MNKIFDNKQEFTELYRDAVMSISGKSVEAASDLDRFNALAKLVAEKARTVATKSDARATAEGEKRVYYFSIEFLIGRLLDNYRSTLAYATWSPRRLTTWALTCPSSRTRSPIRL